MSIIQLSPGQLADLTDWDEHTFDAHFDKLRQLTAALSTPEEVLAQARFWWADPDWRVQTLGFDLLAIHDQDGDHLVPALIEAADAVGLVTDPYELRWCAAHALSALNASPQALDPLLRFADDFHRDIRWQVARGVPYFDVYPENAVQVLLRLMRDPDGGVRDWATFSLAYSGGTDSPEIRDAFLERLDDPEGDTAAEAAFGLAKRRDVRVMPVLMRELADPDVGSLYVDAAEEMGDPRLLPLLRRLSSEGWSHEDLAAAIEACAPPAPPPPGVIYTRGEKRPRSHSPRRCRINPPKHR
ncbi:HEAT repeat domain-containing protein [Herbidospora mongoliensis]|uniref:HEAT repeat domain-containing protein n=1 Tax=Herbidospora mongoliensis TaxID=688067 RepID=UPI00082D8FA7|nr:HEAT repeat domain-containing protein [Herbidospora mongoliensis]